MLNNKKRLLFISLVQNFKLYLNLLLILLFLFPISFLKPNPLTLEDEIYKYSTKRGWDELNNQHHFEKAKLISERAIEIIKNSNDPELKALLPEWENKLQATNNRIETFKDLKSNAFPIGPLLSDSYETHHKFNPGFKTAVEQTMNEVKEVLRQISLREGQVSVLIVQDGTHHPEVEEVAYRKLEGFPYYNPIPMEDQIDLFGEILTFEKINSNPDILSGFFKNEKWERIYIISIEKLNVHMNWDIGENNFNTLIQKFYNLINDKAKAENEAYYNISIHKYSKNEKEKLIHMAVMDTTGVYTGEYFNTSLLETLSLGILILFTIIVLQYKFKLIKNQFGKTLINVILFVILGILFSYGIGYGSEVIIGTWTENKGALEIKTRVILFLLNLFIYPILLLILFKISDYVIVAEEKYYLPLIFTCFSLGISLYMFFYFQFYYKIFHINNHYSYDSLFLIITLANGFLHGLTYKVVIDFVPTYRFLNSENKGSLKIEKGESLHKEDTSAIENHKKIRNLIIILIILIILLNSIFGVTLYYSFFKGNIQSLIPHFILLISISFVYLKLFNKNKDILSESYKNNKNQKSPIKDTPKSLSELKKILENPDTLPFNEKISDKDDLIRKLNNCLNSNTRVLMIKGGTWSGKNRILSEALQDPGFKNRIEFTIRCNLNIESKYLPFIEGMHEIPKIANIYENTKIGKNTQKAVSILSNIISFLPFGGEFISKIMNSDIDLTSKERENYILDTLLKAVRDQEENHPQIFTIENFQDVDSSTIEVMEYIINNLQPNKHKVAFILLFNTDSRFTKEEEFKNSIIFQTYEELSINGLNKKYAKEFLRNTLNFPGTRKNDELFSKIFDMYSEEIEGNRYISIKYITETLRNEIVELDNKFSDQKNTESERISMINNKFIYNGDTLKLAISESINKEYQSRIEKLNPSEIEILEVASILGYKFNLYEISYILNKDIIVISKEIKMIEHDQDIISRIKNSGDAEYEFKKGIYREVFKKRIFSSETLTGEVRYQLYTEYCNRGVEYFDKKGINDLTNVEKLNYAHLSYHASKKYIKQFITANLEYAKYAYTNPELQIDGITSLERIITNLGLDKNELFKYLNENNFLKQFISIFSFYINDFQKLIEDNFPDLNPTIEMLFEKHEYFYNTFEPEQLNHLTAIYLSVRKPENIKLQNSPNASIFNEKALNKCITEEDKLIAKFWKAQISKMKGSRNYRDKCKLISNFDENLINESIEILNNIKDHTNVIKDIYWRKSYYSRILNNLGHCYQIKFENGNIQDDRNKALNLLNECIVVKDEISDYTGKAIAYLVRSYLQEDIESKKKDLEEGIKANLESKNYFGVMLIYKELEKLMYINKQTIEKSKYKKLKIETRILNKPKKNNNHTRIQNL